jgi:hypothetical protein
VSKKGRRNSFVAFSFFFFLLSLLLFTSLVVWDLLAFFPFRESAGLLGNVMQNTLDL